MVVRRRAGQQRRARRAESRVRCGAVLEPRARAPQPARALRQSVLSRRHVSILPRFKERQTAMLMILMMDLLLILATLTANLV